MTYKGIDVSENNGALNWAQIKSAGYEFAVIRTGYGRYHTDTQFAANIAGATAQGLRIGVYHYSYALDEAQARQEATFVLGLLEGLDLSFPVWLDMEDADAYKAKRMQITRSGITAICKAFCDVIRDAGYRVGVYASKSWFESYIDCDALGDCSFWLAQWSSRPTWSGDAMIWQNSDSGTITGHSCKFDTDVAYGYLEAKETTNTELEADTMTYEDWKGYMQQYRKELRDNDASTYSEAARQWCIDNGIFQGGTALADGSPNYMWEDLLTREQAATILYRFAQDKGLA